MPIQGFDFATFAQNISTEAGNSCPENISQELKDFLIKNIHYFCYKAGEGLVNEESTQLTPQMAQTIVQYIAEWLFRKGLSLIYSKIPGDLWVNILQNIAISIYNSAKQAVLTTNDQNVIYSTVSNAIESGIESFLQESKQNGKLTDEQIKTFYNSENNVQQMLAPAAEHPGHQSNMQQNNLSPKHAKLATIAVLLSSYSEDKVNRLLSSFSPEDSQAIRYFMDNNQDNVNLDPLITFNMLKSLKKTIAPSFTPSQISKAIQKMSSLVDSKALLKKIENERPFLQQYIQCCLDGKYVEKEPSVHIGKIILKYLEKDLAIG